MRRGAKAKDDEEEGGGSGAAAADHKKESSGGSGIFSLIVACCVACAVLVVAAFVLRRSGLLGTTITDTTDGRTFAIEGGSFVKDGAPFRFISGEFHYFRVPRALWADRLHKMRLGGLNAVSTYVPWNLHEPRRGKLVFDGELDLAAFIREAQRHGLLVIVRPGPYICAEWEWGGLPAWLAWSPGRPIRVRSSDERFLLAAQPFLARVLSIVVPLQYSRGGPVVAAQLENEYGSFGSDMRYMAWLQDLFRRHGVDCVVFDSNGRRALGVPSLPGVLRTANFGAWTNATAVLRRLAAHVGRGPLFVTEFWCGWFDHFGEQHHVADIQRTSNALRDILAAGASVNFYMYVGGTNFGFMNGANYNESTSAYEPTITSYDYSAPISESGDVSASWTAFRDVIADFSSLEPTAHWPPPTLRATYGRVSTPPACGLLDPVALGFLGVRTTSEWTLTMEDLRQSYGFVLYETILPPISADDTKLRLIEVHDRAIVVLDDTVVARFSREQGTVDLAENASPQRLRILVENMGRINFGRMMADDPKGITQGVMVGDRFLSNWTMWSLPLTPESLEQLAARPPELRCSTPKQFQPTIFAGTVDIEGEPSSTFLDTAGWTKGIAWVNGKNIGRFWNIGPQRSLFVPHVFLRKGINTITVLDIDNTITVPDPAIALVDKQMLG
jgi:beta-galactosidase